MKPGVWIGHNAEHPAAMVAIFAYVYGWPARDEEEPGVDIVKIAARDLFDDPGLTEDELEKLIFRWAIDAEAWMNRHVVPADYKFGWHEGKFYLQLDEWWDERGGPDQMWLP